MQIVFFVSCSTNTHFLTVLVAMLIVRKHFLKKHLHGKGMGIPGAAQDVSCLLLLGFAVQLSMYGGWCRRFHRQSSQMSTTLNSATLQIYLDLTVNYRSNNVSFKQLEKGTIKYRKMTSKSKRIWK